MPKPKKGEDAQLSQQKTAAQLREEERKRREEEQEKIKVLKEALENAIDQAKQVAKTAAPSSSSTSVSSSGAEHGGGGGTFTPAEKAGEKTEPFTPIGKKVKGKTGTSAPTLFPELDDLQRKKAQEKKMAEVIQQTNEAAQKVAKTAAPKEEKTSQSSSTSERSVQRPSYDMKYKGAVIEALERAKMDTLLGGTPLKTVINVPGMGRLTIEDIEKQYGKEAADRVREGLKQKQKSQPTQGQITEARDARVRKNYEYQHIDDYVKQYEDKLVSGNYNGENERQDLFDRYLELNDVYLSKMLQAEDDEAVSRAIGEVKNRITALKKSQAAAANNEDVTLVGSTDAEMVPQTAIAENKLKNDTALSILESKLNNLQQIDEYKKMQRVISKIEQQGDKDLFEKVYNLDSAITNLNLEQKNINNSNMSALEKSKALDELEKKRQEIGKEYTEALRAVSKAGYDAKEATQIYSDYVNKQLSQRIQVGAQNLVDLFPDIAPFFGAFMQIVTSPMRGAAQISGDLLSGGRGLNPGRLFSEVSSSVMNESVKAIQERYEGKKGEILSTLYQWSVSAAESAFDMAVTGGAASVFMGANACADSYDDAIERGLSKEQAVGIGVMSGVFETLFEYLSIEKIKFFSETKKKGFIGSFVMYLKSGFTEGSEEVFTDLANLCADYLIAGGLSEYKTAIANGYTPAQFAAEKGKDIALSFGGGAFGGLAMGGVANAPYNIAAARSTVNRAINNYTAGRGIVGYDTAQEIIGEGKKSASKRISGQAAALEKRIGSGKTGFITEYKAGKLYNEMQGADVRNAVAARAVEIAAENGDSVDIDMLASGVEERLRGKPVGPAEAAALESKTGQQILREMFGNESEQWSGDLQNKLNERYVISGAAQGKLAAGVRVNERIRRTVQEVRKAIEEGRTYTLVKNGFEGQLRGRNGDSSVKVSGITDVTADGKLELALDYDAKTGTNATAVFDPEGGEGTVAVMDTDVSRMLTLLHDAITGTGEYSGNKMTVEAANAALAFYDPTVNTNAEEYISFVEPA